MKLAGSVWPSVALLAAVVLHPTSARAALDPDAAERDRDAVVLAKDYGFCSNPDDPLSPRARELCPLADAIPGCEALEKTCAKPPDPPFKLGPFWARLGRWLGRAIPYVAWVLIALLVGLVGFLVVRAVRAGRDEAIDADVTGAVDVETLNDAPATEVITPAEALLRRAAEAEARGDTRAALFAYLAAALRALDDRGAIRVAKDRTNGEYVRSCQEPAQKPALRALVRETDSVQFGGAPATMEAVVTARARAEQIVHASSSALAVGALVVLSALFASGCSKGFSDKSDPAGFELFADLLERQGAELSRIPGSLAYLPMDGTKGPVVVLDAERVPLEAETRAHLVAWVAQGGAVLIAGNPERWPSEFWAKPTGAGETDASACATSDTPSSKTVDVVVETRDAPDRGDDEDDDDEPAPTSKPHIRHATLSQRTAMTWPSEDRQPRAIAKLESGELYGALRTFDKGKILGLASTDLLTNAGLAVPGNAAAMVALVAALDRTSFAVARREQGISPPDNPFAGLIRVGLGPALVHAALFIPLLFLAYGVRQVAPRPDAPRQRRAFAEHVSAVGGLYARRRAATHALAVYAKLVDDRLRATMTRGTDPAEFLAARSGQDASEVKALYARAQAAREPGAAPRSDDLHVLERLSGMFARALERG